jgi:hypothetical protein
MVYRRRDSPRSAGARVKAWVLKTARGKCECCQMAAPFVDTDGLPYLEVHHIWRLADGGPGRRAIQYLLAAGRLAIACLSGMLSTCLINSSACILACLEMPPTVDAPQYNRPSALPRYGTTNR